MKQLIVAAVAALTLVAGTAFAAEKQAQAQAQSQAAQAQAANRSENCQKAIDRCNGDKACEQKELASNPECSR